MPQDTVYMDRDGAVATLHIDRPDKRNALNTAMWQRLMDLARDADTNPATKVIVITGEGGLFASGADIEEFGSSNDPVVVQTALRAMAALRDVKKPTIAKIRGACIGGGCGIALCCDLRFADTTARFGITPAKLGLLYALADTKSLVAAVGASRAKDILFTGRLFGAADALDYRLIDWLVEPVDLDTAVAEYAARICEVSQFSTRGAKVIVRAIVEGAGVDTDDTKRIYFEGFKGEDFKEGCEAFAARRKPNFTFS
jgi:enoyl-CoA hydratase/carnithine racemase